jgi:hypothetical protein
MNLAPLLGDSRLGKILDQPFETLLNETRTLLVINPRGVENIMGTGVITHILENS